jgi:hypothetical protein
VRKLQVAKRNEINFMGSQTPFGNDPAKTFAEPNKVFCCKKTQFAPDLGNPGVHFLVLLNRIFVSQKMELSNKIK